MGSPFTSKRVLISFLQHMDETRRKSKGLLPSITMPSLEVDKDYSDVKIRKKRRLKFRDEGSSN